PRHAGSTAHARGRQHRRRPALLRDVRLDTGAARPGPGRHVSLMPFRTPPGARRDLLSLIDAELRDRIEEAVDHGCLDAMVSARRASGTPLPKADDVRDREEFTATVRALLERLRDEIPSDADEAVRATREMHARPRGEAAPRAPQSSRASAAPVQSPLLHPARARYRAVHADTG